jgi:hypothetical protein
MIQMITPKVSLLCVVALLLQACAFMPDNWAVQDETIDSEALARVNRVALLDVPEPSHIWLGNPDSATAGFINPLISLAISTHEGDTITNSAFISITTRNELKKWLEQAGKEVILLDAERKDKSKMLENYDQFSKVDADAILEVAPVKVGFVEEPGFGSELSPSVFFVYRLVSTKTGAVIVESNVTYSSFDDYQGVVKGVNLLGPKENIFEDEESIKGQPEEAIRRLQHAIEEATEVISKVVTNTYEKQKIKFLSEEVNDAPGETKIEFSSEIDLNGIYTWKTLSLLHNDAWCFNKRRRFSIQIVQRENRITGEFLGGITGALEGTVEKDKIKVFWYTTLCARGYKGEWIPGSDGSDLEGYWWKGGPLFRAVKNN